MVQAKDPKPEGPHSHLGVWSLAPATAPAGGAGLLKSVLADLPVGVLVQSQTAEILTSNPKALELLGLSEDQILGKTSFDTDWSVIHEDGTPFPGSDHPVPQAIATKESIRDVVMGVFRPTSMDLVWLRVNAIPLLGLEGLPELIICTFTDISDIKEAKEKLERSEALLQATQDLTKVGGWEWDVLAQTMTWTEQTFCIHEFDRSETFHNPAQYIARSLACYDPEDRTKVLAAFQQCEEHGKPYDLVFPFTTAKGRRIWIRTVARATKVGGRVIKVLGNIIDITERRQAEDTIREREVQFTSMAENSPVAIYRYSEQRGTLFFSQRSRDLFGYSPEELVANPHLWHDAIDLEDLPRVEGAIKDLLAGKANMDIVYRVHHTSGEEKWLRDRAQCHRTQDGDWIVDGIVMDISELYRAQEEKEKLQIQLRQSDRLQSLGTLAGGVAHDMNNVLGAILLRPT